MTLSIDHDTKIIRISAEYLRGLLKTVGEIIDTDTTSLDETYAIFLTGGGTEPTTEANTGPIRKGEPTGGHRVVAHTRRSNYYTNAPIGTTWNWSGCGIHAWEHSAYRREPRYAVGAQCYYRDGDGLEHPGPAFATTAEVKAWIDAAPERRTPHGRYYVETDVITTYFHNPGGMTQLGSDPRHGATANRCRQADYAYGEWFLYDNTGARVGTTRNDEAAHRFVRDGVVPRRTPEPW